jgi:Protein of unknown function (DUF2778)
MTVGKKRRYDSGDCDHHHHPRTTRPQRLLAGTGLAGVALVCGFTICANLGGRAVHQAVWEQPNPPAAATGGAPVVASRFVFDVQPLRPLFDSHPLFDQRYAWAFAPETFSQSVSSQADANATATVTADALAAGQSIIQKTQQIASAQPNAPRTAPSASAPPPTIPLPPIRTASLHLGAHGNRVVATAPTDAPTIFEKLFGKPSTLALAYAAPDDGSLGVGQGTAGRYDRYTAVYDISARKVYMPDGTTLEAHSGYGSLLDDPRHADAKDRGVTPPNVYDLVPRESIFHGVRALRLIPVDESKVFGRSGLLAHSFMLGPNGDSNGCVSFRNYEAFLQAYENHEIKRLVVVASLN